jgi:hypothetical protein
MKEVQKNPNEEKINGAGSLLAYAVKGAKGGLHSKAPELLQLMLDRTTLNGGVTTSAGPVGQTPPEKDAAANAEVSVAVVAEAVERVCQNTSRDKSGVLWECLREEVNGLLPSVAEGGAAREDVARALHLLNNAVEHHRGSRVLDYRPMFSLLKTLLQPPLFPAETVPSQEVLENGSSPGFGNESKELTSSESARPSLQKETLRLMLALTASHERIAGASQGPSSIARAAAIWQPAFETSKPQNLLPFLEALLSPARAYSLPFFAASILGSLDRLIVSHPTAVLPLLLAVCKRMEPSPQATPLLLAQSGGGGTGKYQHLSDFLTSRVSGYAAAEEGLREGLAEVWAAVQLLPYAVGDADAGMDMVWNLVQAIKAQVGEEREQDEERQQSNGRGKDPS